MSTYEEKNCGLEARNTEVIVTIALMFYSVAKGLVQNTESELCNLLVRGGKASVYCSTCLE